MNIEDDPMFNAMDSFTAPAIFFVVLVIVGIVVIALV